MMKKSLSFTLISLPLLFLSCDKEDEQNTSHEPPQINILSPAQDATVEDTVVVAVDGVDYAGAALDRFVYYLDNVARYTDPAPGNGSPASVWQWPTAEYEDGYHELRVVGYDADGQSDVDIRSYAVSNVAGIELATGAISTGTSGTISTQQGARIRVPIGAVPRDGEGREATIVFSIEQTDAITFGPPHGQQAVSNVYKFGPSGFTFARPVEITIPVLEGVVPDGYELNLYRVNPNTGQPEDFAGTYAYADGAISAQTYSLSNWAVGMSVSAGASPNGQGCVFVDNQTGGWLYMCVEDYTLTNPGWDALYVPEVGWYAMFAPPGESWPNSGNWWLPQGTYTVCVQVQDAFNEDLYTHQSRQIVVAAPAGRVWGGEPDCGASITGLLPAPTPDSGPCACIPEPTIPVGTGDIQVTLTWWNSLPIDLDLWVVEPNGDRCYFANPLTNSGGNLDRDNLCSNYENGRPENIFWENAPTGNYNVFVHWWSDCGNSIASQDFEVRVVSPGYTNTFSMEVLPDDTAHVTEFVVGSGFLTDPPRGLRESLNEHHGYPKGSPKPDVAVLKATLRSR